MRAWPLALVLGVAAPALAGPPYVTDDPEPTDPGHWEVYGFADGTHVPRDTAGEAGFDVNYGGARDLQLTAVVPVDYDRDDRTHGGLGDIEIAAKYRFLHQSEGSLLPDVAFFPALSIPIAKRSFGTGRIGLFLPLWAQKDFGQWSLFGGGGYTINPGAGQRNFWLEGVGLSRAVTDKLSIGAEVYHNTADADDSGSFTGVNLGVQYRVSEHWSLIGSAGPGVHNAESEGRYSFYVALKADY